ncbi:serine protease gd-like isoform X1 [Photinus pyralis]|uniref:serine protease gd-like isoform X1 n=1 Tax=Photinus pyralis TaxID=7054 RepID=UPI0012672437|nr:serine protease gd-like isoform X1 [Photinus pyralis]
MGKLLLTLLALVKLNNGLETSPCPRLFVYEHMQVGRWYGIITLLSSEDLTGIRLRLQFDRPSLELGNWFGEVSTTNNKDYVIENTNFTLKAHRPQTIRFYLNYKGSPSPKLTSLSLNDKTVCPEPTNSLSRPLSFGFLPPPASNEDEDYYPSDFAFIRPHQGGSTDECGTVIIRRSKRSFVYPEPHVVSFPVYWTYFQPQPKPLITYGTSTVEGEYPWHVALYRSKGFDLVYVCGGVLISSFYVVTVAHCVTKAKAANALNPNSMRVYLGKYYLSKFSNPGIQDHAVEEIKRHPDYDAHTYANDIALVKLKEEAAITDYVRPVCLWPQSQSLDSIIGEHGDVVGWGYDQYGRITDELMQITMPVVTRETCVQSFPQFYARYTSSTTYCAGHKNGSSVCNGDSGGGMVFLRKDTMRWYLRGLVSISIALRSQFCDYSNYVVFTDSAKYLGWIGSVIAK